MVEMNGEQQSIVLFAASILKRMTTLNPPQLIKFHAGLKGVPYPHYLRFKSQSTSQRKQKNDCTPVYKGHKRARQHDTNTQPAKVQINMNCEKVFKLKNNETEISKRQLKSKIRNLQQQLSRCK